MTSERLFLASVLATLACSARTPTSPPPKPQTPLCGDVQDAHARGFIAYARNVVTNPRFTASRESIGIPVTPSDQISFVQTDSRCAKAAAVINRDRGHAGAGEQRVYLLRVGVVYWVEDPTYMAGEYIRGLVIDSTLTTILGRPGR